MTDKPTYYTQEGIDKLTKELQDLKTKGRADIARQIAEARDKGDLSENAEYDAAKDAQGHLEARIANLETSIGTARVIDETQINTSHVSILSRVSIQNIKSKQSVTYMLVSEQEADLKTGKISVESPIGKAMLGKKKGDVITVKIPSGEVEFQILNIST